MKKESYVHADIFEVLQQFEMVMHISFRWKPYGCGQQTGQHGAGQDQTEVSAL